MGIGCCFFCSTCIPAAMPEGVRIIIKNVMSKSVYLSFALVFLRAEINYTPVFLVIGGLSDFEYRAFGRKEYGCFRSFANGITGSICNRYREYIGFFLIKHFRVIG